MSQQRARCPTCNTEIDLLIYRFHAEIAEQFVATDAGEPQYKDTQISRPQELQGIDSYSCPECDTVITTDFEEALNLLRRSKEQLP